VLKDIIIASLVAVIIITIVGWLINKIPDDRQPPPGSSLGE